MMEVTQGRDLQGDLRLRADAVVVGSGASGAVVARELSEAGLEVVVLEEGGYTPPEVYARFRPTETLRHLARRAGSQVAFGLGDSPAISLITGRTVGGSSVLTGGVCFRIPESVLARWRDELGLKAFTPENLEPAYERVEREVGVSEVPAEMRSRGTALFAEGAERLGIPVKPLKRNTSGCVGWGRCNFGCPAQAKLSVDRTYLPKAVRAGARVFSDCLVERVVQQDGRAAGVEGRVLNGPQGGPAGRLEVLAPRVVLCAGTLHTPKILSRSGVGRRGRVLGRNVTLHPAFRVGAFFEERVEGWKGAMQSAYSDALEHKGLTLVGIFVPVNVAAAALPGVGKEFDRYVRSIPNLALFGGMVHDEGGGRLVHVPGREPLLAYRLSRRDKQRMLEGMRVLATCFFEAGARSVLLPIYGMRPLDSPDGLRALDQSIPARLFECAAFHPLGSARMGIRPRESVVNPDGESWELPGLFVADGSIFPTSLGVNSQVPIMTLATRIAWGIADRRGKRPAGPLGEARAPS